MKTNTLIIKLFVFSILFACVHTLTAQDSKYKKEWAKVDSLEQKGLPKSALEVVEQIYSKAKSANDHGEFIKALMHKMKYKNTVEDGGFVMVINDLKKELQTAQFPDNNMMHSLLGEMYFMYYQANRWKFYQRTETVNFENDDIETWSLNKIFDVSIKHYLASLQRPTELQQIDKAIYEAIITKTNFPKDPRPTLYDFMAHRALRFFSNTESGLTRPAEKFIMDEAFYLADAEEFSKKMISTKDTLSQHFYAVKIYQDLLKFRLSKNEPAALVDLDLLRLDFVYRNSVYDSKDSIYLSTLEKLEKKYTGKNFTAEIFYYMADWYRNMSSKYVYTNPTTLKYKNFKSKAIELCNTALEKFPEEYGSLRCKYLKTQIEWGNLAFEVEGTLIPQKNFAFKVNYKNIDKVYYRIGKISRDKYEKLSDKFYGEELFDKLKEEIEIVQQGKIDLPVDKDYNDHNIEYVTTGLPIGFYIVILANNESFSYLENTCAYRGVDVSNITYTKRKLKNGNHEFYVYDRTSGEPMAGVSVNTWYYKYNYMFRTNQKIIGPSFTTNSDGYFLVNNNFEGYSFYIDFTKGTDYYPPSESFYSYDYNYNRYDDKQVFFFLDRAIYRPGQTVYFKGILLNRGVDKNEIVANHKTTVTFKDVNYQEVSKTEVITNEYGTFSGSFVIPLGLLNGYMRLETPDGYITFSVEEYKRPKFETKVLPLKGNFMLDDEVEVKGSAKSYAGSVLSDANVKYRIVRSPVWRGWWSWYYSSPTTEISFGEVKTDEKGEYSIKFKAIPDRTIPKNENVSFNYMVYIDVTDINGETQSTQTGLTVGYVALSVSTDVPQRIDAKNPQKMKIYTLNLNGEFLPAKGEINVYKLVEPDKTLEARKWGKPDKFLYTQNEWYEKLPGIEYKDETDTRNMPKGKNVYKTDFDTKKDSELKFGNINSWDPGYYKLEITSVDSFGNKVSGENIFVVYDQKSTKAPVKATNWFEPVVDQGEPGENAKYLIGSTEKVKVLFEIEHKNVIVEKKWIELNNEQKLIEVPILEKHRGNFSVYFTFVKNNRLYTNQSNIYVPFSNKELDLEFATFRDKLQPGEQEEWQIKVRGPKGEKVAAEMIAALYDASLDKFRANYWSFSIYDYYYSYSALSSSDFGSGYSSTVQKDFNIYYYPPSYYYDYLNWYGFNYYGYYDNYGYDADFEYFKGEGRRSSFANGMTGAKKLAKNDSSGDDGIAYAEYAPTVMADEANIPMESEKAKLEEQNIDGKDKSKETAGKLNEIKARENFSETAFFYPQLMTNANGDVIVKFTIPESLTRWKMMGFAHTKDLKYGFVNNELITQKELMILPNIPRFFRENDKIELPAKISNVTDKDISGVARLEFFDAISGNPVTGLFDQKDAEKSFTIKAGQNTVVTWNLNIPEGLGAIEYKIVAKAEKFTDGEQNAVPVLTNRMLVTESMPLPIRGNQTKEFTFEKLVNSGNSSTLKHEKVTLEFTSNPAWYAIQALPYLIEYPYECAEQTFSRFYANSIATHIANSSPKIKKVFDSWRNTPGSKALLSNLEKNQELKALLLEETPWVLNSQNESERKKRVGLLFDLNKMAAELQSAINKLQKMQSANGGWPWFEGMPESRYITQHIVCGMGHLDVLGVKAVRQDNDVWRMLKSAIDYLDIRMKEDYDYIKKHYTEAEMKEKHIGYEEIHYLYTRSYFLDLPVPSRCEEAFNYFKGQAQKYWLSESIYMQGMIGLALFRLKDEVTPADIIKSLKENAMTSEEFGMFWKDNVGYYWYQAPIERQALLIEFFDEAAKDEKAVDDMKVWLLKQKQTQDWKTTKATVEAVYALLLRGADWLESDQLVEISLGDQVIDPKKIDGVQIEAGTGYFKTSWGKGEIKPEMGKVKVTKKDAGVSWGALYWQYFEQLDKITPAETPLKLEKKLFIERMTERGKVIEPLSVGEKLKVGDKIIVRIELRSDRSMEYVHMKDMRASGFEPINVISRYKYQDGLGYYESTKDAATNFFISYLPKGTYVFEYSLRVTHKGNFSNGITSIQCMYAPEFSSHSEGIRVNIE